MAAHNSLEETWGLAATYAEHQVGDYIRYSIEGLVRSGSILWICAPHDPENPVRTVRYVVQPEDSSQSPDVIWPCSILIGSAVTDEAPNGSTAAQFEQALLEMFATLSIPIIVRAETDDAGQPYYVWHIGESTPQRPFGLYVGIDHHLIAALKHALEKLIAHVQQEEPPTR